MELPQPLVAHRRIRCDLELDRFGSALGEGRGGDTARFQVDLDLARGEGMNRDHVGADIAVVGCPVRIGGDPDDLEHAGIQRDSQRLEIHFVVG